MRLVGVRSSLGFAVAASGCGLLGGFDFSGYSAYPDASSPDAEGIVGGLDATTADVTADQAVAEAQVLEGGDATDGGTAAFDATDSGAAAFDATDGPLDADWDGNPACPIVPPLICTDSGTPKGPDGATFFADFDEGCFPVSIVDNWGTTEYDLSCYASVSPPASLHLKVPSYGNFNGFLTFRRSLGSFPVHAHVEFDLLVSSIADGTNSQVFALGSDKTDTQGSGFLFVLYPDPAQPVLDCYVQDYQPNGTPDQAQNCTGAIQLKMWSHFVFDLQRSDAGAPMHLAVSLGGSGLLFDRDLRGFVDGPNFHFDLSDGTYQDGGGAWNLYFDNVTVIDR